VGRERAREGDTYVRTYVLCYVRTLALDFSLTLTLASSYVRTFSYVL